MRNNDRLLYEIGELDDEIVPAIVKEKKKAPPATWAAAGSIAAAAAVAGFVIFRGIGTATAPWEEYRIYSPAEYGKEIIIDDPPKVPCGLINYIIYWNDTNEALYYLYTDSDIEAYTSDNPWSGETELTSLPVFKNRAPAYYFGPVVENTRCLAEEQLSKMLENTAKALGVTVQSSSFKYDFDITGDTKEDGELPLYLTAECGGEAYGTETVGIDVYSDSTIKIGFGDRLKLPDEYMTAEPDNEQKEKILSYLTDRFKNLLQFENPVLIADSDKYSGYGGKAYNSSENIAESIVNYNMANAQFMFDEDGLLQITLTNLLCISDYIGDYPVISLEKARELLLGGSYYKRFPDSFLKDGKLSAEDIKAADLIYFSSPHDSHFVPYYRFYVEIDSSSLRLDDPSALYGDVYVPAIEAEYILNDEITGSLDPDFSGSVEKAYPADEVSFPDGSAESKNAAARFYGDKEQPMLEYGFGFLRYGKPVFQSSFDDPDCYNYDTWQFNDPVDVNIEDPDYFKVKAGDVLENGMTVDSANYKVKWKNGEQTFAESKVEISGEAVYEGIILCRQGADYAEDVYDLVFYADSAGDMPFPMFCSSGDGTERLESFVGDSFAFITDSGAVFLTNTNSIIAEMGGYSELLSCDNAKKARVTFTKINYRVTEYNAGYISAVYKDLEILE